MPKSRKIAREVDALISARGPRSSVRLVRSRQAGLRDYNRLVAERPEGPSGDEAARWFMHGFESVRRDVLAGYNPEEAFDLSTSVHGVPIVFNDVHGVPIVFNDVHGVPIAFNDGAAAARALYNSQLPEWGEGVSRTRELAAAERAQADKLAKAYRVKLPT